MCWRNIKHNAMSFSWLNTTSWKRMGWWLPPHMLNIKTNKQLNRQLFTPAAFPTGEQLQVSIEKQTFDGSRTHVLIPSAGTHSQYLLKYFGYQGTKMSTQITHWECSLPCSQKPYPELENKKRLYTITWILHKSKYPCALTSNRRPHLKLWVIFSYNQSTISST